jgi:biopolymer transport protein ExbD
VLKRPSSRRKSKPSEVTINLIPMLDALVTMISFLLYSMSFFAFVSIQSPVPITSSKDIADKLKERPLQLTISIREKELEVWSPFKLFPAKRIAHLEDGMPNIGELHQTVIEVKRRFPNENKVVIVPNAASTYDTIIAVMDASRTLEATDTPLFMKNATTGVDEQVKALFPEVIFGNLLGDS